MTRTDFGEPTNLYCKCHQNDRRHKKLCRRRKRKYLKRTAKQLFLCVSTWLRIHPQEIFAKGRMWHLEKVNSKTQRSTGLTRWNESWRLQTWPWHLAASYAKELTGPFATVDADGGAVRRKVLFDAS